MDKILIEGGRPLRGEVCVSGAKNAALPMLAAALLSDGWNTFDNVPGLVDVHSIKRLIESLGSIVETDGTRVRVNSSGLNNHEAPYDLVRKMRASILVLGPLVARLGKARVSLPGGCAIGARPINLHLKALRRLGAEIRLEHGYVEAIAPRLRGADFTFDTETVTGTENIMMAAAMAEGETILRNAAKEPEVVALADMLNRMGADIRGAGTSVITIRGVEALNPGTHTIIPDRIETGTFLIAAILTCGDVAIKCCEPGHLRAVIDKLTEVGARIETGEREIRVRCSRPILSADIKTQTYPGFPTDMQAQFMALMTVANGQSIISETIFENRFIHVSELKRMGADITVTGDTAVVRGMEKLSAAPVMASDLRASASLVLAGLVAEGTTEVNRVYHLDRGYEAMEKKFQDLGASIWRKPA
ncbi:MAG: UDP-N-acetylglucosamine 1-carboxyvinyltransferase [Desulfobacterales bacterium]